MIKVKEAIIVEGKYDKIKLSSIIDGLIITTNGFGIFNDKERQYLIRELAKKRGIIVLTAVSYTHLTLPTNSLV